MDDNGSNTCGLCMKYHQQVFGSCKGCPIAEHTGHNYCYDTPYDDYRDSETLTKELAQNMLNFLRELYKKHYGDK